MKLKKIISLLLISIMIVSGCSVNKPQETEEFVTYEMDSIYRRVIAHAMGGMGGKTYLNCYECFHYHYTRGMKYFEIDFRFSTDNKLIGTHMFEYMDGNMTYQEYKDFRIEVGRDLYRGFVVADMIELLTNYNDIYFVIDTKEDAKASVIEAIVNEFKTTKKERYLKRIVPYVYKISQYAEFEALYSFDEYIFTAYQNFTNVIGVTPDTEDEIIDFLKVTPKVTGVCAKYDLQTITGYDQEYLDRVREAGKLLYLFTVDTESRYNKAINTYGATGVITNIINIAMLRKWGIYS